MTNGPRIQNGPLPWALSDWARHQQRALPEIEAVAAVVAEMPANFSRLGAVVVVANRDRKHLFRSRLANDIAILSSPDRAALLLTRKSTQLCLRMGLGLERRICKNLR